MTDVLDERDLQNSGDDQVWNVADSIDWDPELELLYAQERVRLFLTEAMRWARHLKGLTQTDLAERMGISQGRVSRLESCDNDRRLDSVVAHLKAVGAELMIAIKVEDTLIQVLRPEGFDLALVPEDPGTDRSEDVDQSVDVDGVLAGGPARHDDPRRVD